MDFYHVLGCGAKGSCDGDCCKSLDPFEVLSCSNRASVDEVGPMTELLNVHSVLVPIQHLRTNSPIQGMTNPCVWTSLDDPRLLMTLVPKIKTVR